MKKVLTAVFLLLVMAVPAWALRMEDVPRISPQEVMAKIARGEKVVIIDLRSRGAYDHSDIRIKGDIRIAPDEPPDKLYMLPVSGEIITYCT